MRGSVLFTAAVFCIFNVAAAGSAPVRAQPACVFEAAISGPDIERTRVNRRAVALTLADPAKVLRGITVAVSAQSCPTGRAYSVSIDDNALSPATPIQTRFSSDKIPKLPFHTVEVHVTDGSADLGGHRYYVYAFPRFNDVLVTPSGDTDVFTWRQIGEERMLQIALHHPAGDRETADYTLKVGPDDGQQLVLTGAGPASAALLPTSARLLGGNVLKNFALDASSCGYFTSTSPPGAIDAAIGDTAIKLVQIRTDCSGADAKIRFNLAALNRLGAPVEGLLTWNNGTPALTFAAKAISIGTSISLSNLTGTLLGKVLTLAADVTVPGWGAPATATPFSLTNTGFTLGSASAPLALKVHGLNVTISGVVCTSAPTSCSGKAGIDASGLQPGFPVLSADFKDGKLTQISAPRSTVTLSKFTFDVANWQADLSNGVRIAATGSVPIGDAGQTLKVTEFGFSARAQGGDATLTAGAAYDDPARPLVVSKVLTLSSLKGSLTAASGQAVLALAGSGTIQLGDSAPTSANFVKATVENLSFTLRGGAAESLDLSGLKAQSLKNFEGRIAHHEVDVLPCDPDPNAPAVGAGSIEVCLRLHLLPNSGAGAIATNGDALDTRVRFKTSDLAFERATIHYAEPIPPVVAPGAAPAPTPAVKRLRLGSISLKIKSVDLLITNDTTARDFGTGHSCNANFVGQAQLSSDKISTATVAGSTSGDSKKLEQSIDIEPEIAIGRDCYVFVSEGVFGLTLSPQSGATITHVEISHTMNATYNAPEDHLALAGLLHSGNVSAVIQKAGFDRVPTGTPGAQDFKMVFQIDKKTTLALNAVNNADTIIRGATAGLGALFGLLIHR